MNKITFIQHNGEALNIGKASGLTALTPSVNSRIDTPFAAHNDTLYSLNGVVNLSLLMKAGLLTSSLIGGVSYGNLAHVFKSMNRRPRYMIIQTSPRKSHSWFDGLISLVSAWGYHLTPIQLAACLTGQACKRERVYFIASNTSPVSVDKIVKRVEADYRNIDTAGRRSSCIVHKSRYFGRLAGTCLTATDQGCSVKLWPAPSNDKPYTNPLFSLWLLGWVKTQFPLRKVCSHPMTHFPDGAAEVGPLDTGPQYVVAEYQNEMRCFPKDVAFHPHMRYRLREGALGYEQRLRWLSKLNPLYSPAWVTPHLQLIVNRLIEHETGVPML